MSAGPDLSGRPPSPGTSGGPRVAAVRVTVPEHRYEQDLLTSAFAEGVLKDRPEAGRVLSKISANSGVRTRNVALPVEDYPALAGFTHSNDTWLEHAMQLTERALRDALAVAGIAPHEVDVVFSTTVTGLVVPSLEARLAQRVGLREDVKRVPLFGLGCAAGAAGVARLHDYLRGFPGQVGVLLAVELCSLTVQHEDRSMAGLVAASLFGDGAAAVVMLGEQRGGSHAGPHVLATRSRLYPDSTDALGWRIGANGFTLVLSPDVPRIAEQGLPEDVAAFLADHGLAPDQVGRWMCHPGGPKVIDVVERAFELPQQALAHSRQSLAAHGNMSSVSVLDVLRMSLESAPANGSVGLMLAMGPGFASELVLLRW
ncbi:type III polyketide synthase [Streptomyces sp. NPDC127068]|uniref:type III polyketide synthase n=1 Tax=Streptomyces sp. NPDC127068 TaxID=3347127 RepID=UPI00366552DD